LCGWWAGFARPPPTQNSSLRESKPDFFPLNMADKTRPYLGPWSLPGALPCAPIVRERRYVAMPDRPGLINGQNSVVSRRRTGPHLGGVPAFSPRAGKEFLVGGPINWPAVSQGARPCAPTVRKRRCEVMSGRPGLNPRAKKWEAPFGGSDRVHDRPRIALSSRDGHPAPFTRYSLCVITSPIPADPDFPPTPFNR